MIKFIRFFPVIALVSLVLAYFLGGFDQKNEPLIPRYLIISPLLFLIGVLPLLVIGAFLIIGAKEDKDFKANQSSELSVGDPFELPVEAMAGYKLTLLTGTNPTLTGLTGDTYKSDDIAVCNLNIEHTPPVVQCQCGFYAYRNLNEARFELSMNPGAFLIYVDLFGVGVAYQRGYRAESQVVRNLKLPGRCMRCRLLKPIIFVKSFKLGFDDSSWWQWQARCALCSYSFKPGDKLSIRQVQEHLQVKIN